MPKIEKQMWPRTYSIASDTVRPTLQGLDAIYNTIKGQYSGLD